MTTATGSAQAGAVASNALRASECPSCGKSYTPRRPHQRFCSDHCRWVAFAAARQSRLAFDPPAEPLVPLATPKQIRAAHKPASLAVLRMLQAGPVTTGEFLGACIGRFGARVHELKAVGWAITTAKLSAHSALYTLVGPRDASRGACAEPGCAVCS